MKNTKRIISPSILSANFTRLKEDIRTKYKLKVDNYFHDIIVHIGDNYLHTKQS